MAELIWGEVAIADLEDIYDYANNEGDVIVDVAPRFFMSEPNNIVADRHCRFFCVV